MANSTRSNVATGGLGTGAITYSIDNTNVATIATHTGVVTLKRVGTATVTATRAADANYTTISNSYILTVNNKEDQPNLRFQRASINLDYQIDGVTTSNIIAQGGTGTGAISYRSNNEDVATVDSSGVVTIKSAGKVRITAIKAGDNTYNPIEESYILTVNKIPQSGFRFTQSTVTATYLTERMVTNIAIGGQGTGKIRYKIDKTTFATIDADSGQVTINGAGTAIITADKAEDTNYQAITSSYVLVVNKAQQTGFSFVQASITTDYVQDATISNVAKGGQGEGAITYRSDNRNVATINNSGVVTLQGAGTATITATKAEDANYKAIENSYELTVNKGEQTGFSFVQDVFTTDYAKDKKISNTPPQGGQSEGAVTYRIDNKDVATIATKTGIVTLKGTGKATITATKAEDANYKAIESSYELTVNKGKQTGFRFAEDVLTVAYTKNDKISNIPQGGQGLGAITYDIDNGDVASINNDGELTLKSPGTATITATKAGDDNYLPTSATYVLNALEGLLMTLGIKNIKFAWGAIADTDHYRLQSDFGNLNVFADASTSGFVVTPNSTNIKQKTAQADIALHRYIPLLNKGNNPQYRVEACDDTNRCDSNTAVSDSLTSDQLNGLIGYFKASDARGGDEFGRSVSLSGDGNTLVSSELGNKVYVFVRDSSSAEWTEQAYIQSNARSDRFGWSLNLSGDGNTLAVGAFLDDSISTGVNSDAKPADNTNFNAGAVHVFTRSSTGTWNQQAYIKASNTGQSDQFGWSVSLSDDGNSLAVGARLEDSNSTGVGGMENNSSATNAGAVYVFVRDSSSQWTQQAYIKASNTGVNDRFGESVSLNGDGNALAVGANLEDSDTTGVGGVQNNNSATDSGAVYVFIRSTETDTWSQQAYIKASNTGADDEFGWSVSLSENGHTLAVGAYLEDSNATGVGGAQDNNSTSNSGAVYVFTRSGSTWSQQAYIKASNTGKDDEFGTSISLSGDGNSLAVGATGEDSNAKGVDDDQDNENASGSGAVYFFTRSGSTWQKPSYIKASNSVADDEFGNAVSLSDDGNSLAVGARSEDSIIKRGVDGQSSGGVDSGAVYLY